MFKKTIYKLSVHLNKMFNFYFADLVGFIRILRQEPIDGWKLAAALIRGTFYKMFYGLTKANVTIEFPLVAFYKVRIMGPGSVSIGKNCWVLKSNFQGLTIETLSKQAKVIVGKHCSLGGLTIRCLTDVRIGDRTVAGNSLIQDVAFFEMNMVRSLSGRDKITPLPIYVGRNVWIGGSTCILSGTILSDDSVLSLGSLSHNIKISEYCMASGNPVIRSLRIDKILNLLE